MKKALYVIAVVFGLFVFSNQVYAESYVSAYLGGAIPHDADATDNTGLGGTATLEFDSGLAIGARAGTWINNAPWLGLQIDLNGHFPSLKRGTFTALGISVPADIEADVTVTSLTANALIRYPEGNIRPYAGIGAGWFTGEIDDGTMTILGISIPFQGEKDTAFGWHVLAGVDFIINPNFSVFGEYKYSRADFELGGDIGLDVEYAVSQIYGGVSYHF